MDRPMDADDAALERLKGGLRDLIQWRDFIAKELALTDAEITREARAFATLNGDFVRPTLDQLRRMLFDERLDDG